MFLIYQMFYNKQVLVLQPKKKYIIFMVKRQQTGHHLLLILPKQTWLNTLSFTLSQWIIQNSLKCTHKCRGEALVIAHKQKTPSVLI